MRQPQGVCGEQCRRRLRKMPRGAGGTLLRAPSRHGIRGRNPHRRYGRVKAGGIRLRGDCEKARGQLYPADYGGRLFSRRPARGEFARVRGTDCLDRPRHDGAADPRTAQTLPGGRPRHSRPRLPAHQEHSSPARKVRQRGRRGAVPRNRRHAHQVREHGNGKFRCGRHRERAVGACQRERRRAPQGHDDVCAGNSDHREHAVRAFARTQYHGDDANRGAGISALRPRLETGGAETEF